MTPKPIPIRPAKANWLNRWNETNGVISNGKPIKFLGSRISSLSCRTATFDRCTTAVKWRMPTSPNTKLGVEVERLDFTGSKY